MKSLITSPRRVLPVVLLGVVLVAQVSASAGVPIPVPPPAPTSIELVDGGDGFINGAEHTAVMVRVHYDTLFLPPITSAEGRIVGTNPGDPTCDFGAPYTTTNQQSNISQGSYFELGPFDLSAFPEGVVLCARAFVRSGSEGSPAATSNTAVKDTVAPADGSVEMVESFIVDGYLNLREATNQCCIAANWAHTDPGDVAATVVWFEDSTSAMTAGCGTFGVGPSGNGSVNATCAGSMAQGPFTFNGRWIDAAGNSSSVATTSLVKDTIRPSIAITSPAAGDQSAPAVPITATGTADPGAQLVFRLDGPVIGSGEAQPDGTWSFGFTAPSTLGSHTLQVTATDPASNVRSASRSFEISDLVPVIILPAEGADERGTVTIHGSGRPASTIEIYEGDALIGSARVATTGLWSVVTGLPDGAHTIRARGIDTTTSAFSLPRSFSVDAGLPTVAITTAPAGPAPLNAALLPTIIEGTATDGLEGVARIRLQYFNALGTRVLDEDASCSTCGPDGASVTWDHTPALPLPGLYTVVAQAFDSQGNTSVQRTLNILWAG